MSVFPELFIVLIKTYCSLVSTSLYHYIHQYFFYQKQFRLSLLCFIITLVTTSNLGNLILLTSFLFIFLFDKSKYHKGASELNINSLKNYIKSGQNFIYDTTGSNDISVYEVTKEAHKYGYKIMFILILIDVDTAKNYSEMMEKIQTIKYDIIISDANIDQCGARLYSNIP